MWFLYIYTYITVKEGRRCALYDSGVLSQIRSTTEFSAEAE